MSESERNYDLTAKPVGRKTVAPRLPYQPPNPRRYRPRIGLIGCGGITASHLRAYRQGGWEVVAFCDHEIGAAEARRREFYPKAAVFRDYSELLSRSDIDVVDVALHPEPRVTVIEAALKAGKHVLSQKPFVLNLDDGERLAALARRRKRRLAVNQNGRWAPYFSYLTQAVRAGWIGEVQAVSMQLNWDHTWIQGTPFEAMRHVVLYDFAIHWFDMTAQLFRGRAARSVFAASDRAPGQRLKPPMIAGAAVVFEQGVATLSFDAHSRFGPREGITVTGTKGTLRAEGELCAAHDVTLITERGWARPKLRGRWFDDGFRGAMGELLCAIEEDREPGNSAQEVMTGLGICFAAVRSAETGRVEIPGKVRALRGVGRGVREPV